MSKRKLSDADDDQGSSKRARKDDGASVKSGSGNSSSEAVLTKKEALEIANAVHDFSKTSIEIGGKSWPIVEMKKQRKADPPFRSCTVFGAEFRAQNPAKESAYAERARNGSKNGAFSTENKFSIDKCRAVSDSVTRSSSSTSSNSASASEPSASKPEIINEKEDMMEIDEKEGEKKEEKPKKAKAKPALSQEKTIFFSDSMVVDSLPIKVSGTNSNSMTKKPSFVRQKSIKELEREEQIASGDSINITDLVNDVLNVILIDNLGEAAVYLFAQTSKEFYNRLKFKFESVDKFRQAISSYLGLCGSMSFLNWFDKGVFESKSAIDTKILFETVLKCGHHEFIRICDPEPIKEGIQFKLGKRRAHIAFNWSSGYIGESGSEELLEIVVKAKCKIYYDLLCEGAASTGKVSFLANHIDFFDRELQNRRGFKKAETFITYIAEAAIVHGQSNVLEWLIENKDVTFNAKAKTGRVFVSPEVLHKISVNRDVLKILQLAEHAGASLMNADKALFFTVLSLGASDAIDWLENNFGMTSRHLTDDKATYELMIAMLEKQNFAVVKGVILNRPSLINVFDERIFKAIFPKNVNAIWNKHIFAKKCPPVDFLRFLISKTLVRPSENCLDSFWEGQGGSPTYYVSSDGFLSLIELFLEKGFTVHRLFIERIFERWSSISLDRVREIASAFGKSYADKKLDFILSADLLLKLEHMKEDLAIPFYEALKPALTINQSTYDRVEAHLRLFTFEFHRSWIQNLLKWIKMQY